MTLLPILLLATFSLASRASGAPDLAKPLTIDDAVRLALEKSPTIDSAVRAQMQAELKRKNSVSVFLPRLSLEAIHGLQNQFNLGSAAVPQTFENPTAPWTSSLGLTLSENLYDNGASITNNQIAALQRDIAKITAQKTRDEIILKVQQEFYEYSRSKILLDVQKEQLEILQKQMRSVRNQYQQGFKIRADFLRLRGQVLRAETGALNAAKTLEVSAQNLKSLMGVETAVGSLSFVPVAVSKTKVLVPTKPLSVENTFDFRVARLTEKVEDRQVNLAFREYLPRIDLTSSVSYLNGGYLNSTVPFSETDSWSWNALITLRYDILDWGIQRRNLETARLERTIKENTTRQTKLDLETQVVTLMSELDRNSRNHETNRELVSLEEETYRGVETQYRAGQVAYLDLITSLGSMLEARQSYYESYYSMLKSVAQYKFYEGTISEGYSAD